MVPWQRALRSLHSSGTSASERTEQRRKALLQDEAEHPSDALSLEDRISDLEVDLAPDSSVEADDPDAQQTLPR